MQIPLLIIGTAFDGPAGIPMKPSSIEEAFEVFGGYVHRNIALTATQTTFTISDTSVKSVEFFTRHDGILTPFTDITLVNVDNGTVTIERMGVDTELIARYKRPFTASDTYVYKAFAEAKSTVPEAEVWVMRVGGASATKTIGTGPAKLAITGQFPGSRYNETVIVTTATSIAIMPPHGLGGSYTYNTSGKSVEQIASEINSRFLKGYSPVTAASIGSGEIALTNASTTLTGGADGLITDEDALEEIQQFDFRGIKVIHIAGETYPYDAEGSTNLTTIISDELLTDSTYPTLYVQGIDYDEADEEEFLPAAYADSILENKSISRAALTMVAGQCRYTYAPVDPYWSSAAPAFAALVASNQSTCLWKAIDTIDMRPYFTEESLIDLRDGGVAGFTYSLSRGWVVFSDTTTHPEWPSTRHLAYLALVDAVYPVLEPVIGSHISDQSQLQAQLEEAIAEVSIIREAEVTVKFPNSQTITVEIVAKPYGAVGAIKFGVAINANFSR